MPELPEVETIRAFLDEHVRGKTITAIDLDLPRLIKNTTADRFQAALTGQTLEGVSRRGKYPVSMPAGPSILPLPSAKGASSTATSAP